MPVRVAFNHQPIIVLCIDVEQNTLIDDRYIADSRLVLRQQGA
jgi:hypothetical protein